MIDWTAMDPLKRNNVHLNGHGRVPIVFVHGYGCDQNMWRFLTPHFADEYKIVLLDLVGFGGSDLSAYDRAKYATLDGHSRDLLDVVQALDLQDSILVGHSVSSMIAVLAANRAPERFSRLVLVAPSPCYLNDGEYAGGFQKTDIDELLEFLDQNFLGWSRQMAPAIMGSSAGPEMVDELTNSFCRTDPEVAKHFGRVTFLSDHRRDVVELARPSLILQVAEDMIAPRSVGNWLHRHVRGSTLTLVETTGHCPHMTAPVATAEAIKSFLALPCEEG
jgi:sigma-B regulation protein RsbQ